MTNGFEFEERRSRGGPSLDDAATALHEMSASAESGTTYYFPVEIEVVGGLSDEQMQALAENVIEQLNMAIDSRRLSAPS